MEIRDCRNVTAGIDGSETGKPKRLVTMDLQEPRHFIKSDSGEVFILR
jgi:hypothetical protein